MAGVGVIPSSLFSVIQILQSLFGVSYEIGFCVYFYFDMTNSYGQQLIVLIIRHGQGQQQEEGQGQGQGQGREHLPVPTVLLCTLGRSDFYNCKSFIHI
jgi:hypothetical protein